MRIILVLQWLTFNVVSQAPLPPLKIVQFGDSYSAGSGARNEKGERDYVAPDCCLRSPSSWGAQYVNSLRSQYAITFINRACSVTGFRHMYEPQFREFDTKCGTPETLDEIYVPSNASSGRLGSPLKCDRGVVPQIDIIDDTVDLVLLTIGGNDLFFRELIIDCVLGLLPNSATPCQASIASGEERLPSLITDVTGLYKDIWLRIGENGRIIVFQYPNIVQDIPTILKDKRNIVDGPRLVRDITKRGA